MSPILISFLLAAAAPTPARITAVTVYPDRVEVTREVTVRAEPGSTSLAIGPLPVAMDDASLRVTGHTGAAGLTLGDVEVRLGHEVAVSGPELPAALAALETLQQRAGEMDDRLARIQKMRGLLDRLQATSTERISKELADSQLHADSWQEAYDFLSRSLDGLAAEERATRRSRDALGPEMEAATARVSALRSRTTVSHKVVSLTLASPARADVTLRLTGAQPGASWTPAYEAVMDPDSGEVTLGMFAWVRQTTGESWDGVRLRLASGAPSLGIDLPELRSLAIGPPASASDLDSLPVIGSNFRDILVLAPGAVAAEYGSAAGGFAGEFAQRNAGMSADLLERVAEKVAAFGQSEAVMTFDVEGTISIGPDGQAKRVAVSRAALQGRREYLVVPEVRPAAHLLSRLTAPPDRPLPAGPVRHYVGTTLVGSSSLPLVAPGEEFVLPFGVDDRVKVERPALHPTTTRKGDETLTLHDRRVAITNRTGRPIDLEVRERVPVPTDSRIRVTVGPATTTGHRVDDSQPGIHTWQVALAPDQKTDLALVYTVRHPSDLRLALSQ